MNVPLKQMSRVCGSTIIDTILLISVFHHNAEHWAVIVRVEILNDVFMIDEFEEVLLVSNVVLEAALQDLLHCEHFALFTELVNVAK